MTIELELENLKRENKMLRAEVKLAEADRVARITEPQYCRAHNLALLRMVAYILANLYPEQGIKNSAVRQLSKITWAAIRRLEPEINIKVERK